VARAEAYLRVKFHLDPSNRFTTIHQRYRQTDRTDRQTTDRKHRANRFTNGRPKTVIFHPFTQKPPPRGRVCTKFGAAVGVADIITCNKFVGARLRSVDSLGGESKIALSCWQSLSPLTLGWRYRAARDTSAYVASLSFTMHQQERSKFTSLLVTQKLKSFQLQGASPSDP